MRPTRPLWLSLILPFVAASVISVGIPAFAANRIALRRTVSENRICGLEWSNDDLPISLEKVDGETRRVASLEGIFDKRLDTLSVNGQQIQVRPDGSFRTKVVLKRKSPMTLTFIGVNPKNETDIETIELTFATDLDKNRNPASEGLPDPDRPSSVMDYDWTWGFYKPRLTITPSLGYTTTTYQQTALNTIAQTSLTAKLSFYDPLTPRFDFNANAFITALPLTVNPGPAEIRFIGANLRYGYSPPWIPDPFKLSLMFGGYMTMMSVPGDLFGYPLLLYPQVYPVLRMRIGKTGWMTLSYKYAPLTWTFEPTQREIAYGISYTHQLKSGNSLSASVDYADLQFIQVDSTGTPITFRVNSASFSLGYGF